MTLIDDLKQARSAKLNRISLLESGDMSTTLYGIDVTEGTLAQEREEVKMIEAVLGELGGDRPASSGNK